MAEFVQTTLMDSYAGGPHITETQLGLAHQATFGPDDYVLEGGRESEAQVLTNNSIRIFDAVYCIQGRRDVIPASGYTDVTIDNGTQGMNRNDIIVRRYKKDEVSEEESTEYAVIKGTPSSGEAVDPSVTTGDIRSGAILHEMKLYRVKLTGLNIVEVEPLFNILKNQATLQKEIAQSNKDLSDKVAELNGKTFSKQLTATGLTPRSNRCSIQNGGYFVVGNMCYFQLKVKILTALTGPNYWTLVDGLPRPLLDKVAAVASNDAAGGAARTATVEQTIGTNYGNLVYHNQANASVDDVVNFSGFYMIAF